MSEIKIPRMKKYHKKWSNGVMVWCEFIEEFFKIHVYSKQGKATSIVGIHP